MATLGCRNNRTINLDRFDLRRQMLWKTVKIAIYPIHPHLAPIPGLFILFDDKFDRMLINQFANLCQRRNPRLSLDRSELIAEVFHRTYRSVAEILDFGWR